MHQIRNMKNLKIYITKNVKVHSKEYICIEIICMKYRYICAVCMYVFQYWSIIRINEFV